MQELRDPKADEAGFRDTGDLFDETDGALSPSAAASARGPAGLAVSVAVMLAGAAFLIFAMRQATPNAAPPVAEIESAAPVADAPAPAATIADASPPVAPVAIDAAPAPADTADAIIDTRGRAPRLGPARAREIVEPSELSPRLKPRAEAETAPVVVAIAAERPIALGGAILIAEDERPPAFFPVAELAPLRAARAPLSSIYTGDMADPPRTVRVALTRGETFVDALRRAGVRAEDRNAAAYAFGAHQNLRALRPGQEFVLTVAEENRTLFQLAATTGPIAAHLLSLDFIADAESHITLKRTLEGSFAAEKNIVPLTSRLMSVSGRINGSLYVSAKSVGAPDDIIAALADMFAYDVDFQREIFGGDEFEAIFEVFYDNKGEVVASGDILYGRLKWRGRQKEKGYYLFADYQSGRKRGDYFDFSGQSAKRLLMKTPIDGARLSSGFGARRHPIHGYTRAHKGVDFAASSGTPIKAAGDGVVERAGPNGTFGNYIRIRHANGYKTAYAHLRAFARGVRAGARVDQGDIIGYVGSTGASTGPHLHYEVHQNNVQVNPQNLKIATGVELKAKDLEAFRSVRDRIEAMRAAPHDVAGRGDVSSAL